MASITPGQRTEQPALVLDYTTLNSSQTDYVFRSDTTYLISGFVYVWGTTTIEGGTVVKYPPTTNANAQILPSGPVVCRTGPYRPAIFTASDDQTVGEMIAGSRPAPQGYYGTVALQLASGAAPSVGLSNLRVTYILYAISSGMSAYSVLACTNCQFVNCQYGIYLYNNNRLYLGNALFANVVRGIYDWSYWSPNNDTFVTAQQVTFDQVSYLASRYDAPGMLNMNVTNCVLASVLQLSLPGQANVVWNGDYNGFYNSPTFGAHQIPGQSAPFQTVGAGSHYLTGTAGFRNVGTTAINAALLADLRKKTTYPPMVCGTTFTSDTTLTPQVQRDTDVPDLGYHYEPMDYLANSYIGITNATLTVGAGTVIGTLNSAGLWLQDGSALVSAGTPMAPNWLVRYPSVQEQTVALGGWAPSAAMTVEAYTAGTALPRGDFRFTQFACPAGGGYHVYNYLAQFSYTNLVLQDCVFWSGANYLSGPPTVAGTGNYKNNLFHRSTVVANSDVSSLSFSNNLFWGVSSVSLYGSVSNPWYVFDNAFDACASVSSGRYQLTNGYNAYLNGSPQLSGSIGGDVVQGSFTYAKGPLGDYYQLSSNLSNVGSVADAALVGLYHYTTTTNQVKELSSRVDIGLHYVALNTNGVPVDTDSDGVPDYADADSDGDALPDAWELQSFGNLDQTGTADPDGDQLTNLQEYQLGTNPTMWDTDGDGLSDSEELAIPVDVNNPALGRLDPLHSDTGNTGVPDGDKDSDHDRISNLAELRTYACNPGTAHTFTPNVDDAEYLFTAVAVEASQANAEKARLEIAWPGGDQLRFTISGADPGASYDLYYVNSITAQRWQWRRVYADIRCDHAGQAMIIIRKLGSEVGFFTILNNKDDDLDGQSNGYESWFHYSGRSMSVTDADSDGDGMRDGWEVQYGLDPTLSTGDDGAGANPDGDSYQGVQLSNKEEHDRYAMAGPNYDPRRSYNTQVPRPVVSISSTDPILLEDGQQADFTVKRDVGSGNLDNPLTVYYAIGGSATYASDYTLSPIGTDWPRIYSVQIPQGSATAPVTVTTLADTELEPMETVVIALTPFGVSPPTQQPAPGDNWDYVVDWQHNRAQVRIRDGKDLGADGYMVNLDKDPATGALRIKPTADTSPLPFVNAANSGRGTVARIQVVPNPDPANPATWSSIVGEYYTKPGGGGDPSRTTVDRYGNVWVANRSVGGTDIEGSVTCIGVIIGGIRCDQYGNENQNGEYIKGTPQHPILYNTCVDRDGDGLVHTSRGLNNVLTWASESLPTGDGDEAVTRYVRTVPINVRSISVDGDNNIWVGSMANGWQEHVHGITGLPMTGRKLNFGKGGYGGLVDGYGTLWSAGYTLSNPDGLLRVVPGGAVPLAVAGGIIPGTSSGYGMGIDPQSGDVWLGNPNSGSLWRFTPCGRGDTFALPYGGIRGVAVDGHGNVWVAKSDGRVVLHLKTTGEYVGEVDLSIGGVVGNWPYGVCVDAQGMVWAACFSGRNAMRIDRTKGAIVNGTHIGEVVESVDLGASPTGTGPYNYSDMSGFLTLGTTKPASFWDFVDDSGTDNTVWQKVEAVAATTGTSEVVVEVRAANRVTDLPTWPFLAVQSDGTMPAGVTIKGRYLEVRTTLLRDFAPGATSELPQLQAMRVTAAAAACSLQIASHPQNRLAMPGDDAVTFTVSATGAASYQWLKNGNNISGADSATLILNNVQYGDGADYAVRVTGPGCTLQSRDARLHVKGNAPSVPATPTMYPPSPNPGATVTLSRNDSD